MASNSETGHGINLKNAKLVIDTCANFGLDYQPSNTLLTLANASSQWMSGVALHEIVGTTVQTIRVPIDQREAIFDAAVRLAVRTVDFYASTAAMPASKKDVRALLRKLTGSNVRKPKDANGVSDPNWVSNSQQSYMKKQETFSLIVNYYSSDANYAPNETDMQLANLQNVNNDLQAQNENMGVLLAPAISARIDRNHLLYDEGTGLVDVMLAIKKYVRALYGATSPEYKSISGIKFKKIKS